MKRITKISDKVKSNKHIFLIILLACSFIVVGHISRIGSDKSVIAGESDYYQVHLAKLLQDTAFKDSQLLQEFGTDNGRNALKVDGFVVDGRAVYFTPYHYLSAYFSKWFAPTAFLPFMSGFMGVIALLLFYILLRRYGLSKKESAITLILLMITPAFLTILLGNVNSLAIVCILAGIVLITAKANGLKYTFLAGCGVIFLIISSLFSWSHAVLIILGLGILFFTKRASEKTRKQIGMVLAIFSITILLVILFFKLPIFPEPRLYEPNLFINQLSDFGEETGVSIFLWILVIIGVISTWKNKKEWGSVYIIAGLFLVASFFISKEMNSYLSFLFSVLAMKGILRLHRSVWEVEWLQRATMVIIICGLLFSSVSFLNMTRLEPPSSTFIEGLRVVNEITDPDDIILSHSDNGYYVEALAERIVLLDNYISSLERGDQKRAAVHQLFQTRDLSEAKNLLKKYNIDYILITRDMKEGKVWTGKNQGLLFLLRSNETFKNVYTNQEIEVWKVLDTVQ